MCRVSRDVFRIIKVEVSCFVVLNGRGRYDYFEPPSFSSCSLNLRISCSALLTSFGFSIGAGSAPV